MILVLIIAQKRYTHLTPACNFFVRKMLSKRLRWVDTQNNSDCEGYKRKFSRAAAERRGFIGQVYRLASISFIKHHLINGILVSPRGM